MMVFEDVFFEEATLKNHVFCDDVFFGGYEILQFGICPP